MQEVMAELQQLGGSDPQSQQKFLADLQQTDPALWPLLLQQLRATAEYRKKYQERTTAAGGKESANPIEPLSTDLEAARLASAERNAKTAATPMLFPSDAASQGSALLSSRSLSPETSVVQTIFLNPQNEQRPSNVSPAIHPLKTSDQSSVASEKTPIQKVNFEKDAPAKLDPVALLKDRQVSTTDLKWHNELAGAIQALESQVSSSPKTSEDFALHTRLRMLYAMAGCREEAMRPIPDAPGALQDFWSKELFGLTLLWEDGQKPDASRRAAEGKLHLSEALSRLGESAPLLVRNPAFCTAVQSYGCITPFKKNVFLPGQEVLLYAELENFASRSTSKGFHTSLQSSYQILDSRGQRVTDHVFTTTEEYCQNYRRDFYIPYHLRLPVQIASGNYTLQLTVEDLNSKKVGQGSLEFTIKNP
jgi:hypothetical protein